MKKTFQIGLSVAGTIIGAGFATGKEIMLFFPEKGLSGTALLIISLILMFAVSMLFCFKEKPTNKFNKTTDKIFDVLFMLFIAASFGVMLSGGGETIHQITGLPMPFGSIITYAICIFITSFSLKGIYVFNSIVTPVMIISVITASLKGIAVETFLTSAPIFLSISYCGYNLLSFLPFIKNIKSKEKDRHIFIKGLAAGFVITAICGILMKTAADKFSVLIEYSEIPMLQIALLSGRAYGYFYSVSVYCAILTTAVSCLFCLSESINKFAVSLPLLLLSFAGFDNLVRNVYTFFGYAGTVYIIYIILTALFYKSGKEQKKL